jgi:hypothetical protein
MNNNTEYYLEVIDTGKNSFALALSIVDNNETITHALEQCFQSTPCLRRIIMRLFVETHFATHRKPRKIITSFTTCEKFRDIEKLCQDWEIEHDVRFDPDFNETCMKNKIARFQPIPRCFNYTTCISGAGEKKIKVEHFPWNDGGDK